MTHATSLLFELDGRLYAIAVDRVHAIVEPPPVSAVPFAPMAVEGLVAVGGAILPLLDLAAWLDGRPAAPVHAGAKGQVMVIESGSGRLAVRVARVLALVPDGGFGEYEVTLVSAEQIRLGEPAEGAGEPGAIGESEAAAAPAEPRSDPFVVVGVGAERYGLPIEAVREIAPASEVWAMPGAPPAMRGLAYLRGVPLPVLSLAALLGRPASSDGVLAVLVQDGVRYALEADQIVGVRRFRLREEGTDGYVDDDGSVILPLDLDRLVPGAIRARFRSESGDAPAAEPLAMRRLVTFTVAGEACALPVEEVERAIDYRMPVSVPRTGAGFSDAIEVGGSVVPVVDLRAQLRPGQATGAPGACLVTRVGRHGYALAIDRLDRLATVPASAIEAIAEGEGPVIGIGRLTGRPFWVLSARRLVQAAGAEAL